MRNLGIVCAVACAACGDRTPAPTPHPATPAVAASSHAAPSCPLAPPPSGQPAADPPRDDFFTGETILYVGATAPQLGVFVVDTGGAPRLMVGPVARGYQYTGPLDHRIDDAASTKIDGTAPWSASYTLAAPAAPDVALEFRRTPETARRRPRGEEFKGDIAPNVVRIDALQDLGDVTVDLLDHHFVKMTTLTVKVGKGRTETPAPKTPRRIDSLAIHAGTFYGRLDLALTGEGRSTFGNWP
jgi:hypothetical protein